MILKSLRLENIRSYKEQTIDFPPGTTLFEGDIGSGKSTILMAIEFALFGLGSEKGAGLLRTNEREGTVSLTFDLEGREYTVSRRLVRKGRSIRQGEEGALRTPQGIMHLSPTELKEKILEILGFNEPPDPKAQSLIYRYAVFTPQEEMKAILYFPRETRLQTIRKALRIEDYKTAAANATAVANTIEKRAGELEAMASDVEGLKQTVSAKEAEMKQHQKSLAFAEKEEKEVETTLNRLKEELTRHQNEQIRITEIAGRIKPLETQLEEKKDSIGGLSKEIEALKEGVKKLEASVEVFKQKKPPTTKTVEELRTEIRELEKKDRELRKTEAQIEAKIKEYRTIETKGICPTCDRPADPKEFTAKVAAKLQEKQAISAEVQQCADELLRINALLQSLQDYEKERLEFEHDERNLERSRLEIETRQKKTGELEEQIGKLGRELEAFRGEAKKLEAIAKSISELQRQIQKAEQALREARREATTLRTKVEGLQRTVAEMEAQIKAKLEQRSRAGRLRRYVTWLEEFFIPTVGVIEEHALLSANQEVDRNFRKWFSLLVEDPAKEARIDESFTPIVEQDGYEQDIHYLSGGERTSVALAYRLALNTVVQRTSTGMRSNLLILDEPTDGFSKEQLGKVREILDELQCPQVVIVSHEKELESFADQIFNITKTEGISSVTRQG